MDFERGEVRLAPGSTKNDEGRHFIMTPRLRQVLTEQREYINKLESELGITVPHVFTWPTGTRFYDIRKRWKQAFKDAELPEMLVHDFRRTAVRNLVRAGISELVAMRMTGHKTRSVFDRYNIVSRTDLAEAAEKLSKYHDTAIDAAMGTATGTMIQ